MSLVLLLFQGGGGQPIPHGGHGSAEGDGDYGLKLRGDRPQTYAEALADELARPQIVAEPVPAPVRRSDIHVSRGEYRRLVEESAQLRVRADHERNTEIRRLLLRAAEESESMAAVLFILLTDDED